MNQHDPAPDLDPSATDDDGTADGKQAERDTAENSVDREETDQDLEDNEKRADAAGDIRRPIANCSIRGQLTAHFVARDVVYDLDGWSALMVMSNWQQPPVYQQAMNPSYSSAARSWIGIDLADVVGFTWRPHRPPVDNGSEDRWTFDPLS